MRLRLDPRRSAVETSSARQARVPVRLLAAVSAAWALAGCDTLVPLPDSALLRPQPPPKCERRPAATDEGGEAARLKKLDYEAQCYRHAELIARNRLGRLQASIKKSAKARKAAAKRRAAAGNP